ncbi:MAG: hypothetical protein Phog2KO_32200 [Phototrophicaceae bacterium]
MLKKTIIALIVLLLATNLSAQSEKLSTVIEVIGDDISFQRANTSLVFELSEGSSAPFGIGDIISTGQNGRVLITVNEDAQLLVLPNSEYEITDFSRDDTGQISLEARQEGIVLHDFNASVDNFTYQLDATTFSVSQAEGRFVVWSIPTGLQAVTVANGDLIVAKDEEEYHLTENTGFAVEGFDIIVELDMPLHASQVVGLSINCQGTVDTGGTDGLRLRAGAALDYQVVDVLQDEQSVPIVGTTENGQWYRIPFQTGFGWIFSSFIEGTCLNLPEFMNLIDESPERIDDATAIEIELLEPFYGTPQNNSVFYR